MARRAKNPKLDQLVSELLKEADPSELFGKEGVFAQLKSRMVNQVLEAEMEDHLGYNKHSKDVKPAGNRRNGFYQKTVLDENGSEIELNVPRDRDAEFEPQIIPKGVRQFKGFDDKVISLYGRGMTMREIQSHLQEIYSTEVSPELISKVTDKVIDDVEAWQNRALDSVYPIIYFDCIHIKTRDNGVVCNKAVYLALGVNIEGKKDILGMWISHNEGAKFWMQVINEIKNRGVNQICIVCVDGLKGFPDAINAIFPKTIVQSCIVHMVRNSMKYVSYKDYKEVAADLKLIYTAINEKQALEQLESFAKKWDSKYPVISSMWRDKWAVINPLFDFPDDIRKAIYTTNAIEAVNRQIRKIIKNKGVFPDDKSIMKILFLALTNAAKKWTMPIKDWPMALNQFHILCELPI